MPKGYLIAFAGMALSGAGLVLSIPVLFGPHELRHEVTSWLLALVFLVLWAVVLLKKRNGSWPGNSDAGDT